MNEAKEGRSCGNCNDSIHSGTTCGISLIYAQECLENSYKHWKPLPEKTQEENICAKCQDNQGFRADWCFGCSHKRKKPQEKKGTYAEHCENCNDCNPEAEHCENCNDCNPENNFAKFVLWQGAQTVKKTQEQEAKTLKEENDKNMSLGQRLLEVIAQAYTTKENSHKQVDIVLANAIIDNVLSLVNSLMLPNSEVEARVGEAVKEYDRKVFPPSRHSFFGNPYRDEVEFHKETIKLREQALAELGIGEGKGEDK